MPLVARDMLQGLVHVPLVGFWADNSFIIGSGSMTSLPAGTATTVFASYTVPATKIARVGLISLTIEKTASYAQCGIYALVGSNQFFAQASDPVGYVSSLTYAAKILKPGELLRLMWGNSDAVAHTLSCYVSIEEIDI